MRIDGAVYAAGEVLAGDVALAEVRRGGPDGALVDALDPESRRDLEDALFERAGLEPDVEPRAAGGGR